MGTKAAHSLGTAPALKRTSNGADQGGFPDDLRKVLGGSLHPCPPPVLQRTPQGAIAKAAISHSTTEGSLATHPAGAMHQSCRVPEKIFHPRPSESELGSGECWN